MPINFSFYHKDGYVLVGYSGRFDDKEMLASWKKLYEGNEWTPGLNELVDCSQVDGTDVTSAGVQSLAEYTDSVFAKHDINSVKVAIYAPKDLPFGMARMYGALANEHSETVRVFKSIQDAVSWIKEERKDKQLHPEDIVIQ